MIQNVFDIEGTLFPAGRRTRVMVGPNAPVQAERFSMGHVTIFPGGEVPTHEHQQEEVYFISQGEGVITVAGKDYDVKTGSYLYIPPNMSHNLRNTSQQDMVMIFCYAPKDTVDHWQQELKDHR